MGCGKSRDFPAESLPADSRRPRPSRVSRAKLDLDDGKSSPILPLSKKSGRVPDNSSGGSCTGDDHEATASTSHTLTPAVTPHGDAAAGVRVHRRSEPRGGRSPKGSRRRELDHDRAREDASCSMPGTKGRSEYDGGLGDGVRGKENEIPSAAMADRVRTRSPTTEGTQPAGQRHKQHRHAPESSLAGDATKEAAATWPPPPPVPLILHLFLENHRPRDISALPSGGSRGNNAGNGSSSVRRVWFTGGLAYEGQLLRREEGGEKRVPHGWGNLTFPDKGFYQGCWHGGVVHGKGALHLPNGNSYLGSWAYGRKHGLGSFTWADGSRHEGYYLAGERSGVGTMHYASGAVYEGDFKAGRRHGVGRLELARGGHTRSYDGDWENDLPHGHGVFVDTAEGERFSGAWRHGIRSGGGTLVQRRPGKEKSQNGGEDTGEEAEREDEASSELAWYSGNFEHGLPHGDGTMKYCGATFCGHVEQGVPHGGGRIDFGDKMGFSSGVFEGSWIDGIPCGSGRWWCKKSGVALDCSFEQGYSRQIWST